MDVAASGAAGAARLGGEDVVVSVLELDAAAAGAPVDAGAAEEFGAGTGTAARFAEDGLALAGD